MTSTRLRASLIVLGLAAVLAMGWLWDEGLVGSSVGPTHRTHAAPDSVELRTASHSTDPLSSAASSTAPRPVTSDESIAVGTPAPKATVPRIEPALPEAPSQAWFLRAEGRVLSQTGRYRERATLEVTHPDGAVVEHELHFDDVRGHMEARFNLVKGMPGRYRIRPRLRDWFPLEIAPKELVLSESRSGLTFLILDDVDRFDLDVVLLDDQATAVPAGWIAACFGPRLDELRLIPIDPVQPELVDVPEVTGFRWFAGAPGFMPIQGTALDLRRDGGNRIRTLESRLEPGWGNVVQLVNPIRPCREECALALDGAPAGSTDPDGFAVLAAPKKPGVVWVNLGGGQIHRWTSVDRVPLYALCSLAPEGR